MKKYEVKKEILLITTSSFAKRELSSRDASNGNATGFAMERLEEACWNGLLGDFFRQAPSNRSIGDKLFLWKIHVADKFLCIELSQAPSDFDCFHSLDPYSFMPLKNSN